MLRRVLQRSPFPASLTASGKTKLTAAQEKKNWSSRLDVRFVPCGRLKEDLPMCPLGFHGKVGEVDFEPTSSTGAQSRRLVAGLSSPSSSTAHVRDYRLAVTTAVRKAMSCGATALTMHPPLAEVVTVPDLFHPAQPLPQAELVEKTAAFAVMGAYRYDRLRSATLEGRGKRAKDGRQNRGRLAPAPAMELIVKSALKQAIETGSVIGSCVNDARNLGNLREDEGVPQFYVEWARRCILPEGVKVRKILCGRAIEEAGLHLLYNVGKGSRHQPYVMVLEYVGNPRAAHSTALVGKGVTFDCGGLNVKPYGSMETMHTDMMGAATALSTLKAAATLRLPVNVVAAVGLVENAIGPDSYHPSSILTSLKGSTVEIRNTDAEGRLVLADLLTYLQRDCPLAKRPRTIVDIATLTGAIIIGLGSRRAGLFSTDRDLSTALMRTGTRSGEELWPMPIGEEHVNMMRGQLADLVNAAAGREAGSCTAAAFLSHFVDPSVRWAHLDIAGTADAGDKPKGYEPGGVTGYGVQLLVDFLRTSKKH